MSLLKMLQQAQGGQGLGELARQFGMDQSQAEGLAGMLAPAIGSAAKRRTQAQGAGGLDALLGQLQGERQAQYFDDAAAAAQPEGRAQGEQFLEQLLGSREATNQLSSEAANRAGVDQNTVAQFLPAIAAMLQGGMQRQTPDSSIQGMLSGAAGGAPQGGGLMGMLGGLLGGAKTGQGGAQGGGTLDMLNQMFDADGDGSALDDILEKVMR